MPEPHLHNEKVGPSSTRPADPPRGQGDSTIHRAAPDSSGTRGCPREEEGATATTVAVSEPKSVFGPPLGMTQAFLHKPVTKWAEYPQSTQGKALRAPFKTIDDVLRARTRDERDAPRRSSYATQLAARLTPAARNRIADQGAFNSHLQISIPEREAICLSAIEACIGRDGRNARPFLNTLASLSYMLTHREGDQK